MAKFFIFVLPCFDGGFTDQGDGIEGEYGRMSPTSAPPNMITMFMFSD
jgi:hypothetical protein